MTQQLNFLPEMTFHRKWPEQSWENSFPENLMIKFPENAKKHTCGVFYNLGHFW